MKDAIIGGLMGGIVSPLILAVLKHFIVWRSEKRLELKGKVFDEAVSALAKRAVDALDPQLQSKKQSAGGLVRETEYRSETLELMERSRSQVRAFFKAEAADRFDKAANCKLSLDNIPNTEFEAARTEAISALASELGVQLPSWVSALTRRWSGDAEKRRASA